MGIPARSSAVPDPMALAPAVKLAAAILRVTAPRTGYAPYYGVALTGFIRREIVNGTLAITAQGVLLWCAAWVATQPVEVVAIGLIHEVCHWVFKHAYRSQLLGIIPGSREARLANLAMDACINEMLRQMFPKLCPADWIYPETLGQPEGLCWEDRYRRLREAQAQEDQNQAPGQAQEGQGEAQEQGQGAQGQGNQTGHQGQDNASGEGQGQQGQSGGGGGAHPHFEHDVGRGRCGGCCGNPDRHESEGALESDGRSEADQARMRREVAQAVKEWSASKGRGTTAAGTLIAWADSILGTAKVDWRQVLAATLRGAIATRPGAVDLTYRKVSRRQAALGYGYDAPIMPALHQPVPRVAVVIDTSGSMGTDELRAALAETAEVLRTMGATVKLATCDAKVQGLTEVRTIDEVQLHGGGGTDMRPAFVALEAERERPEIVVCITDGQVGDGIPKYEPDWCRTVFILVGVNRKRPCTWGEQIEIDETGAREVAAA